MSPDGIGIIHFFDVKCPTATVLFCSKFALMNIDETFLKKSYYLKFVYLTLMPTLNLCMHILGYLQSVKNRKC